MAKKSGFDRNIPWNEISLLLPAGEIESHDILKACISAMAALVKANALVKTLPNETVLVHTLPLQEARRSSEIENILKQYTLSRMAMDEQDAYSTFSTSYIASCLMFRYFTLAAILSRIGLTITVVYVKLPKMEIGSNGYSMC